MFKPGDLVRFKIHASTTTMVAIYNCNPLVEIFGERRVIHQSMFNDQIGEILQSEIKCLVWWPGLNGYNVLTNTFLKPANEQL